MFDKKEKKEFMILGAKKVEIVKITPSIWKVIAGSVSKLPSLIVTVMQAPKDDMPEYLMHAFEISQEEIIEVIHKVTGVQKQYLFDEVGLDEIIEYVVRVVKKNNLDKIAKDVQGAFSKRE